MDGDRNRDGDDRPDGGRGAVRSETPSGAADRHGLIVGCGSIGERHLRNLRELGVGGVTVVDSDPERRRAVADQYGVPTASTLKDGLSIDPDFVVVAVPNSYHVDVALPAARRGCDLFVEKPLSHAAEGVDDLVREVDERNLCTLVGCNMRFHPGIRKAAELLDDDVVGEVLSVRVEGGSYLPEWHPGKDYRELYSARVDLGGGAILDYIHEIDYCRWLFGDVDTVSCFAGQVSELEIETEDVAELLLQFENDAIGEIHVDYVQRPYRRAYRIIGEHGTITWSWEGEQVEWYVSDEGAWRRYDIEGWEPNDMYLDEMRHYLACLEGEAEPTADVRDGYEALRIALAAKHSAESGKHVSPSDYLPRTDGDG